MRLYSSVFALIVCLSYTCVSAQNISQETLNQLAKYPGNAAKKVELLSSEIKQHPRDASLVRSRGNQYAIAGRFKEAQNDFENALKLDSSARSHSELAWFLATVPTAKYRDSKKSLSLAQKACDLSNFDDVHCLGTLAAAHAANGNFSMAKTMIRAAMQLATSSEKIFLEDSLKKFDDRRSIENGYRSSGEVFVINETGQSISIRSDNCIDGKGESKKINATWQLQPNQKTFLALGKDRINVARFGYRVETSSGSTPGKDLIWIADHQNGDRVVVTITNSKIPANKITTAKPVIPNEFKEGLNTAKEFAETANQIAETYDEFKKLTSKIPQAVSPSLYSSDLIVKRISVSDEKTDGNYWDGGYGATKSPDLQVVVIVNRNGNSNTYRTSEKKNTTYEQLNEKLTRIQEGDEISIFVYDLDVLDNDTIGTYTKTITKELLQSGSADWTFDQVHSLQLKFEL